MGAGAKILIGGGLGGSSSQGAITGDVSVPAGSGSRVATLATVATAGTEPADTAHVPQITIDAKGRVTSLAQGLISIVSSQISNLAATLAPYAPLASPALTGSPTVPTASVGTNTTQAASTAFVLANAGGGSVNSRSGNSGATLPEYIGPAPSGDTTGATDSAALAAAITAAFTATPSGGEPWLILAPGVYYVNATLQLPGWLHLCGAGGTNQATVIRQATGTTLNAVLASSGWTTNANATSVFPTFIQDLMVIGIVAQASGFGHGIVLQSFQSNVENVYVQNVKGDAIRFDNAGVNGTTTVSNTMVENYIRRCQIRTCGRGIVIADTTNSTVTDGWILDCIVQNPTSNAAIYVQGSAGWKIDGNHVYGVAQNGIQCDKIYQTSVTNNYVENAGSGTTLGTYAAFNFSDFNNDGGNGSVISNNRARFTSIGNAGSTLFGIFCQVGSGNIQTVTISNNAILGITNSSPTTTGIYLANQSSSASTYANISGNIVVGFNTNYASAAAGGVMEVVADVFPWLGLPYMFTGPAGGTSGLCLGQTMDRALSGGNITSSNGSLFLAAVYIPAGVTITKLGWMSGTVPATAPTHQWLALFNSSYTMLASTADQGSAAVATNTSFQYSITATAAGAATSFTTTYGGLYFLGILLGATTTIASLSGATASAAVTSQSPIVAGIFNAETGVPAYPFTASLSSAQNKTPYLWAS